MSDSEELILKALCSFEMFKKMEVEEATFVAGYFVGYATAKKEKEEV